MQMVTYRCVYTPTMERERETRWMVDLCMARTGEQRTVSSELERARRERERGGEGEGEGGKEGGRA